MKLLKGSSFSLGTALSAIIVAIVAFCAKIRTSSDTLGLSLLLCACPGTILAGISLALESVRSPRARFFAGTSLVLGGIGFALHFTESRSPFLMAPHSAIALILISLALLTVRRSRDVAPDRPRLCVSEICSLLVLALILITWGGYIFQASELYRIGSANRFSPMLSWAFLSLAIGSLCVRPEQGAMSVVLSFRPGGVVARRLLALIVGLPGLLGLVSAYLWRAGFVAPLHLLVFSIVLAISALSVWTWRQAKMLNRVDEERAASELRYRLIFDGHPYPMFLMDVDTYRIVDANRAATLVYGYTREELLRLRVMDLKVSSQLPAFLELMKEARRSPRQFRDVIHRRKNGTVFDVEVNAHDVEIDGKTYRLAMVIDVSDRKKYAYLQEVSASATQALASSLDIHNTLKQLAEMLTQGLLREATFLLLGDDGALDEVASSHLALATKRSGAAEREKLARLAVLGRREEIDEERLALPLLSRGTLLGAAVFGRSERSLDAETLATLRDVAFQVAIAIENSQLYDAARRAVRAREEILEVVSHDLKNPLGAIQLNVELLRRLSGSPDETTRLTLSKSLDNVQKSADRAMCLIRDLLDQTKVESGQIELQLREQDCAEMLDDVLALFSAAASERGIRLERGEICVRSAVRCDRERVLQALANLVGNAVKFTASGRRIRVGVEEGRDEVTWLVDDEGPGIDERDLPHIFDRYWQPKNSRSQGTGLGLSIARGIVEAHGGRLWAESRLGEGSRFYFTLPLHAASQVAVPLHIRLGMQMLE